MKKPPNSPKYMAVFSYDIICEAMGKISLYTDRRQGENSLKKGRSKPDKHLTEPVAAIIIIVALLLSMAVSALGYLGNRDAARDAAQHAVEAAAQAAGTGQGPFANYRQMKDPLLVLVNEQTPLPSDWQVTPRMVDDEVVDLRMYEDYTAMCRAAAGEDVWFWVASGYRSVEEQENVLNRAVNDNMKAGMTEDAAREDALRTIARPGYSEHHTGLVIDLNEVSDAFEDTKAFAWLQAHGSEYGFVQRYKTEKSHITGKDGESWHYRYVGRKHAKEMERLGLCLEEYVIYLQKQGIR